LSASSTATSTSSRRASSRQLRAAASCRMFFNAGCRFFCNPVAGFAITDNCIRLTAYRHSARFLPPFARYFHLAFPRAPGLSCRHWAGSRRPSWPPRCSHLYARPAAAVPVSTGRTPGPESFFVFPYVCRLRPAKSTTSAGGCARRVPSRQSPLTFSHDTVARAGLAPNSPRRASPRSTERRS
jgi:hypothetical protein